MTMWGMLILIVLVAVVGGILLSGWKDKEAKKNYHRLKDGDASPCPGQECLHALQGNNAYDFKIIGEAAFQENLLRIAGSKQEKAKCVKLDAIIQAESTNQFDAQAVRVQINGYTVGYFDRQTAMDFKTTLAARQIAPGTVFKANASIVGGWKDHKSEGDFSVYLDIDNRQHRFGL
jgi:hypothetical protein